MRGVDFADGRVIIGLKPGVTEAEIAPALAVYQATVISSMPRLGQKVLGVPKGTVPQAVAGLSRYSFITVAAPDMLAQSTARANASKTA
jgi:hypothetical protein